MDYREPPRITTADARLDGGFVADDSPRRPRRFDFVRPERHLDLPRVLLAALAGMLALGFCGYLMWRGARSAVEWLHVQPDYELRFTELTLAEPPPEWFRGGREAFLKRVRENAQEDEVLRVLDLAKGQADPEKSRIHRAFRLFPFVEDVTKVEYPPRGIVVHLVYKQPVAIIPFRGDEPVILDRNAHVLPNEDIDLEKLPPPIQLLGARTILMPSPGLQPGLPWRPPSSVPDGAQIERCVKQAANLAAFFLEPERAELAASTPALKIIGITVTEAIPTPDVSEPRGFFLVNAEKAFILWGPAPGEEAPGALSASEKWAILAKWAKITPRPVLPGRDYWAFSRTDLEGVRTRPQTGPQGTGGNPG
ncbi:hypothetical protein OJF2_15510 [Aquisphaera giovannonii]|uniref:Uncharacterized protein n=1 Tax=Aquisphaera giovannonii TaxID=406548 RepID=A0A5B9VZ54_9BACT|nr:hypothetical protein [Aquisphaera giovannonii]QEH33055.1 hypothetical protein OJF2_15510 [Aquisphaera giovannonii]